MNRAYALTVSAPSMAARQAKVASTLPFTAAVSAACPPFSASHATLSAVPGKKLELAAVMLVSMRSMFHMKNLNLAIGVAAVVVFAVSFLAMRTQAVVGDRQFLRSMIPHHSGAILMCEEASLSDPEIVALCRDIVASQKAEIAKMEQLLAR